MADHFDFTNPTTELTPAQLHAIETHIPTKEVAVGPSDDDLSAFYATERQAAVEAAQQEQAERGQRIDDALAAAYGAYEGNVVLGTK